MKKGWILLLILIGIAFLVSCGRPALPDQERGDLVKNEAGCGQTQPVSLFHRKVRPATGGESGAGVCFLPVS